MKRSSAFSVVVGLAFAPVCASVLAQPAPATTTRADVKMERAEFLKTHAYDAVNETWVLKPGLEAPSGMKSRAQIKAERDEFLKNNRWDEKSNDWVSLKGMPRRMDTMTREQVKMETAAFLRTHRYDEQSETWMLQPPAAPKK